MKKLIQIAIVLLSLITAQASAEGNTLELTLFIRPVLNSYLADGAIVGTGKVIYRGEHTGFQVWLDSERLNNVPARYVIRGKNNRENKLFVRLEQTGWKTNEIGSGGIMKYSPDAQADFSIIADGEQRISVDEYIFVAGAKASQKDDE